jgi:hypothetical protein
VAGGQEGDVWGDFGLYREGGALEPVPMTTDNQTFPGAPQVDIMEPCNYARSLILECVRSYRDLIWEIFKSLIIFSTVLLIAIVSNIFILSTLQQHRVLQIHDRNL